MLVLRELKKADFAVKHQRVENAVQMREALNAQEFDLIISDYSLPNFSGPEALAVFKESGRDYPFLIVSGTVSEETAVGAMRAGAHDFLVKAKFSRLGPAIDRELREAEERKARREAEQAILVNERRYRSLIENAQDIITVIDETTVITYVSPSVERVLGYRPDEVVGSQLMELIHPEDQAEVKASYRATVEEPDSVIVAEARFRHKDGSYRVLESYRKNLLGDSVVAGVVVNSRDLTERKAAAADLLETNVKLEKALNELRQTQNQIVQQERLRALGEMASGVAHDFNNALSSVLGFSEAILMYPEVLDDKEQTMEFIQMINTAAKDGANVVSRLSEFYRQREATETLVPVNLNKLIEGTISLTAPRWRAQAQANGVHIDVATELADVPDVPGAEAELRQGLTNLIFNAVDAMPRGGTITIRTSLATGSVLIEVSDQGTGMSEETARRCLEPFFTTKGQRGTGLGLAMVYGLIQRHHGDISIHSVLGEGTTLRILLPIDASAVAGPSETGIDSRSGPRLRVLVVENEPMVRKVITDYLKVDGHQVTSLEDGPEALEALADADLVITDKVLGKMSGVQLAAAIKSARPELPVILLTGFGDSAEADLMPQGVARVVTKPFTLADFRRALAEVVHPKELV